MCSGWVVKLHSLICTCACIHIYMHMHVVWFYLICAHIIINVEALKHEWGYFLEPSLCSLV